MHSLKFYFSPIFIFFKIYFTEGSIDMNLAEFQYIADHLSEKECNRLAAALHFNSFELPKDLKIAERKIPNDISCLDLLLHWNSAQKEGKGKTHLEVCHRLNQIGREDLAQWLSKTVFHGLSKDLKVSLVPENNELRNLRPPVYKKNCEEQEIKDEARWRKFDSLLEIFIVLGLISLIIGSFVLCILCFLRKRRQKKYEKLANRKC